MERLSRALVVVSILIAGSMTASASHNGLNGSDSDLDPFVDEAGDMMTGDLTFDSATTAGIGVRLGPAGTIRFGHPAAVMTANQDALLWGGGLVWTSGNDGPESGLDADTLDGKHSSDLAVQFVDAAGDTMSGDLVLATGAGLSLAFDGIIAIGANNIAALSSSLLWNGDAVWTGGNDGAGSGLDADFLDGRDSASFWSADNDGQGSGLDADTLDGFDSTAFAEAVHSHPLPVLPIQRTATSTIGTGCCVFVDVVDLRVTATLPAGWYYVTWGWTWCGNGQTVLAVDGVVQTGSRRAIDQGNNCNDVSVSVSHLISLTPGSHTIAPQINGGTIKERSLQLYWISSN